MDDRYVGTGFDLFDQSCFWVLYTCVVKRNNLMVKDVTLVNQKSTAGDYMSVCVYSTTLEIC